MAELDIKSEILRSSTWREIATCIESGTLPQSIGVILPKSFQFDFIELFLPLVLGGDLPPEDMTHPDVVHIVHQDEEPFAPSKRKMPKKAPSVEKCREVLGALALTPISATCRLCVIWNSERLLKGAANSLLKVTEEPPQDGRILYLSEFDNFIPTIKSRIRLFRFHFTEETLSVAPPQNSTEWAAYLSENNKKTREELLAELEGFAHALSTKGQYGRACDLANLANRLDATNAGVTQVKDAVFLLLYKNIPLKNLIEL